MVLGFSRASAESRWHTTWLTAFKVTRWSGWEVIRNSCASVLTPFLKSALSTATSPLLLYSSHNIFLSLGYITVRGEGKMEKAKGSKLLPLPPHYSASWPTMCLLVIVSEAHRYFATTVHYRQWSKMLQVASETSTHSYHGCINQASLTVQIIQWIGRHNFGCIQLILLHTVSCLVLVLVHCNETTVSMRQNLVSILSLTADHNASTMGAGSGKEYSKPL